MTSETLSVLNDVMRANMMLVGYHTTKWTATISDAAAAQAAADASGAPVSAFKVGKNMMAGHDERLKNVALQMERARRTHYANTWAWADSSAGMRLLSTVRWMEYMKAMGQAKKAYQDALDDFIQNYEADRDAAILALNMPAGSEVLYPTPASIAGYFSFRLDFQPISAGTQFMGLPKSVTAQLADSYERRMAEKAEAAKADSLARVREALMAVIEKLGKDTPRLRESSFTNIREAGEMVDLLNVTKDEALRDVGDAVRDFADTTDHKACNADASARKSALAAAEQVIAMMDSRGL